MVRYFTDEVVDVQVDRRFEFAHALIGKALVDDLSFEAMEAFVDGIMDIEGLFGSYCDNITLSLLNVFVGVDCF